MSEAVLTQGFDESIVPVMHTIEDAIDLFDGDCARRGLTNKTRATYRGILYEFADEFPKRWRVDKLTSDDIRRFLAQRGRSHSQGTRAHTESCLASFFKCLYRDGHVQANPMDRLQRTQKLPSEALNVVTVSSGEVEQMLDAAGTWAERLCLSILAYLGPRRHAVAMLKLRDYDRLRGRIRFEEKGGKVIWKPIPGDLRDLIEAAIVAGVICDADDYLVPPEGPLYKPGKRDDRVIYRLVKKVAKKAGVNTHVHALRAAFAVFYLEQGGSQASLQDLMGHSSPKTTEVYLRRLNREQRMEPVRGLSWRGAGTGNAPSLQNPQIGGGTQGESYGVGAGGFEPPDAEAGDGKRDAGLLVADLAPKQPETEPV